MVLSYVDYQRLRDTNIESWSQEDICQFLVLDCFSPSERTAWVKDAYHTFAKDLVSVHQKYRFWNAAFLVIDIFFSYWYLLSKRGNKKNVLIQNSRYPSIILEATKKYHVGLITQGKKDRIFAIKNRLGYMSANGLDHYVIEYLKERNITHLYQLVAQVEKRLKNMKPDYIVLRDDCQPIERTIIFAAKKLGIPTFIIQHGVYDYSIPIYNCKAADYVLVWGEYFKDSFVKQGIRKPEDMVVLGYPYAITKEFLPKNSTANYTVCYLGQDMERFNKDFFDIKVATIKSILTMCKKLNMPLLYRPHPFEDRTMLMEKFPDIQFTPQGEKLEETFLKADIFISFTSTALMEAAMRGKISLQFIDYPVATDNLEMLGVCDKSFRNLPDLEQYLSGIASLPSLEGFAREFNNNYIDIRHNPGQRFLEIFQKMGTYIR